MPEVNEEGGVDLEPPEYLSFATLLVARHAASEWLAHEDVPNLSERSFEHLAGCVEDVAEELFRSAHARATAHGLDVLLTEEWATRVGGPATADKNGFGNHGTPREVSRAQAVSYAEHQPTRVARALARTVVALYDQITPHPTEEYIMDTVTIYPHKRGRLAGTFDWRRTDGNNGRVIATSHNQGYVDVEFCERMARRVNGAVSVEYVRAA